MPPANFVGSAIGVVGVQDLTLSMPTNVRARDTLLIAFATDDSHGGPDFDADELADWALIGTFSGPSSTMWVMRREAQPGDVGSVVVPMLDPLSDPAIGVLIAYRNLDPAAAIVGASGTSIASSTNFVCPSRALAAYSDLYLGFVYVEGGEVAVTPPVGTTERLEVQSDGITLEVFELLAETPGATGTKIATIAGSDLGIAASIALSANALVGFGKSFSFDPIGAIGLPSEGV